MVKERGMGWVQDIVPNHMAYHPENFMLMDVLENGPNSKYINYFDINWDYAADDMRGKVLAPFLGNSTETALIKTRSNLRSTRKVFL
jgi:(1->4)-alpha-D-glucan 1-alpha-D-glucosylmutase